LLSEEEQWLFRLLAVFVGGATLEEMEQVAQRLGGKSVSVLDGMTSLLDKHLIQRHGNDAHDVRLFMLQTIREYGLEALAAHGELEAARQAHAQRYLALAEEAESHVNTPAQQHWFARLEQEYDNLRAAMSWSIERDEDRQRREVAWRFAGTLQWY